MARSHTSTWPEAEPVATARSPELQNAEVMASPRDVSYNGIRDLSGFQRATVHSARSGAGQLGNPFQSLRL